MARFEFRLDQFLEFDGIALDVFYNQRSEILVTGSSSLSEAGRTCLSSNLVLQFEDYVMLYFKSFIEHELEIVDVTQLEIPLWLLNEFRLQK